MTHPLIVSYYTPGTAYEDHASALKASVDRLGLDSRIEPRAPKASWVENCAQKALFVRDMRQQDERPILWIDADAILRRPVTELERFSGDFAVVKRGGWSFYGGQVYFGSGPNAEDLIERWCRYCTDYPNIWDQVSLGYAWWDLSLETDLQTLWLEPGLFAKSKRNWLARYAQGVLSKAAVVHKQESRRSKAGQRAPRESEFSNDHLPAWWRQAATLDKPFVLDEAGKQELGLL